MNLQKILGTNYKWLFLLQYSFRQGNLKAKGFVINQAGFLIELAFIMFVWQYITGNSRDVVTFLFVGFMISHIGWNSFAGTVGADIVSGKITSYYLRPSNFFLFVLIREIGNKLLSNSITSASVILLLPFFASGINLPSSQFLILLPVILVCVFLIDYCASLLLSSIAFFDYDYNPWMKTIGNSMFLLMGVRVPFYVLPQAVRPFLESTPFAWSLFHPIQIYLNKYDWLQSIQILLIGFAWVVIMFILARISFKKGQKLNEAVGL